LNLISKDAPAGCMKAMEARTTLQQYNPLRGTNVAVPPECSLAAALQATTTGLFLRL